MSRENNQAVFLNAINRTVIGSEKNDYLFLAQLKELLSLINKMEETSINEKQEEKNSCRYAEADFKNIISIVGERGTGKSSLMYSLHKDLLIKKYEVFDIVDPSSFNDSLSILELFLGSVYSKIKKENELSHNNENVKIYNRLRKMVKTLGNIKIQRGHFVEKNPESELLDDINARVEFRKDMSELFKELKKSRYGDKNNNKFILCIDDIDMTMNQSVYEMLEDIRKFMPSDIIIILSYREKQLFDSVFDIFVKNNSQLLEQKMMEINEIKGQVARYIEKIIPVSNRVHMPYRDNVWNYSMKNLLISVGINENEVNTLIGTVKRIDSQFVKEDKNTINNDEKNHVNDPRSNVDDPTVIDWIEWTIYHKTKIVIRPIDPREFTGLRIPSNLRGINQLIYITLFVMKTPIVSELEILSVEEQRSAIAKKMLDNIRIYRDYLNTHLLETLANHHRLAIEEWITQETGLKNFYIYGMMTKFLENQKNNHRLDDYTAIRNRMLSITEIQPINVALADVHTLMEIYKSWNVANEEEMHFIYILKIMYSMELLGNYLKIFSSDNSESNHFEALNHYLQLMNAYIVDDAVLGWSGITNTVIYKKLEGENIPAKLSVSIWKFFNCFVYAQKSVSGDVASATRKTGDNPYHELSSKNRFRYYRYFNFDNNPKDILISAQRYAWNPFTWLAKRDYITAGIKDNKDMYIVYSIFDLDILLRLNYSRQSESEPVKYMLGRIREAFKVSSTDFAESALVDKLVRLSTRIFTDELSDLNPFEDLFNEGEIKEIWMNIEFKNTSEKNPGVNYSKQEWLRIIKPFTLEGNPMNLKKELFKNLQDRVTRLEKPKTRLDTNDKELFNSVINIGKDAD